MASRRIELVVESLPPEPGVRGDCVGTQRHYPLSELAVAPHAFLLRLQDSAGAIRWEPWGDEGPAAGRVFAAVLRGLYHGRRWRMNLALHDTRLSGRYGVAGDADWDSHRRAALEYASAPGLSHAFEVSSLDPDDPSDTMVMSYWWCPKQSLSKVLGDAWSQQSAGCVAPWPDRGALEACFAAGEAIELLARLLSVCRLVFQGRCEGEEMVILSHHATRGEVENAVQRPSVQRALHELSDIAVFAEPEPHEEEIEGTAYMVYEKPGPGGGGRRRARG